MHSKQNLQWYHILIILLANSITTQLQKPWIFYYIPTYYNSVLFRSLHYYRLGLIILTRNQDVVVVIVFLTSTTVVLNHFAEGSQIHAYDFVTEPHKEFYHKSTNTISFIARTKSVAQNIKGVTERHCLSKGILSLQRIRH